MTANDSTAAATYTIRYSFPSGRFETWTATDSIDDAIVEREDALFSNPKATDAWIVCPNGDVTRRSTRAAMQTVRGISGWDARMALRGAA